MEKEDIYEFLVRVAIPKVREKRKLPPGISKSDWIWDAVYRAHRDVLTARQHVAAYSRERQSYGGEPGKGANNLAVTLYEKIAGLDEGQLIFSAEAISYLTERFPNVGLGAIQKLVNMSLKYLVILQAFGKIDLRIDEKRCDCSIDSVIIKRLTESHPEFASARWTKLASMDEYNMIQQAIESELGIRSRLLYDFMYWQ